MLSNSLRVSGRKEGVGTYCPYHTREASRIAYYLRDLEVLREFHE